MKSFLLIVLTNLSAVAALAQVAKTVVVEHFTNSRCGVCAGQNPSFNTNLVANPGVMRISYHPTSPYVNCVFAQHNVAENDARTNFYGVYGSTPRLAIMGSPISNSPNPYQNPNLYNPYQGQTSPYRLKIYQQKEADTIRVRCVLSSIGQPGAAELRIYVAAAEDTIFLTTPNGEGRHYNVFRKTFFGSNGLVFSPPAQGDSLVWEGKMARHQAWNFNRIFAFGILQNAATRALEQSDFADPKTNTITSKSGTLHQTPLDMKLFPNPSVSGFRLANIATTNSELTIYDATGKLVLAEKVSDGEQEFGQLLPAGLYKVRLTTETQNLHSTWIKY